GRRRMARLPHGSQPVICEQTIAPGAKIQNVYVFAGVPDIFASQLMAVMDDFKGEQGFVRHEIDVSLAESSFAAELDAIQQQYTMLEIGSYPSRCGNKPCGKICISGLDEASVEQAEHVIKRMLKDKEDL
ncbi:MAG: competence/damage-inducible protein A, partial [Ghiorsea sp.]